MSAPQTPFYPMTHDDAQDLIAAIGEQSKFADPYDSTATYSQGDHCIHAGKYYAAKQDISTAEEWTAAHWEEVQVGEEITAQAKSIGKILPVITGTTNNSGYTISSGEYFEANGKLYKATASIPTGNAWSSSATEQTDHGAINALNGKMLPEEIPVSGNATVTVGSFTSSIIGYKTLSVMDLLMFVNGVTITNSTTFGQITVKPKRNVYLSVVDDTNGTPINGNMYLNTNGTLTYYGDAITNKKIAVFGTYTFQ